MDTPSKEAMEAVEALWSQKYTDKERMALAFDTFAAAAVKRERERLLAIARGCTDYNGGYCSSPTEWHAFQHGIGTVGSAIEAACKGDPNDTQVEALHRMGARAAHEEK